MSELLVYAIGDSVMWGEGLSTSNKFVTRAATSLAQARGLTPNPNMLAHCGAKIKATQAERIRFANLFPHLLRTEEERIRFTVGDDALPDERPTAAPRLHGEIPRAFPTIHHQLSSIPNDAAASVDLLLITGGANDLDFETVFTVGGNFLQKLDPHYRRIFYDDIIELLGAARQKCPKAHIILTGYYSAFSSSSRFDSMKDMFLVLSKKKDAYEFLSTLRLVSLATGALAIFVYLNWLKDDADEEIENAVKLARATSEAGESRALYWMRKAVSDINENSAHAAIRGPGLAFASPEFLPVNCMFASEPLLWQQYQPDKLQDDEKSVRASASPRDDMRERMLEMIIGRHVPNRWPPTAQALINLHNDLNGPLALRELLLNLAKNPWNTTLWEPLTKALQAEIDRIDIVRISSVFHPNTEGAARYAAIVHHRAEELRRMSVMEKAVAFLPPNQRTSTPMLPLPSPRISRALIPLVEIGDVVRSFGFDPALGLRACLMHAEPDILALKVRTHTTSDVFAGELFLNLGSGGRWSLRQLLKIDLSGAPDLNPHLQPGTTDLFTIDVAGQLRIGDITSLTIEIPGADMGRTWRPEAVTFSIDGHDVHTEEFSDPPEIKRSLTLSFPRPVRSTF